MVHGVAATEHEECGAGGNSGNADDNGYDSGNQNQGDGMQEMGIVPGVGKITSVAMTTMLSRRCWS